MNKRLLLILLLVSAAFNLAVIGSFIYLRFCFPGRACLPPPPPPHAMHGRPGFPGNEMWDRLPMDDDLMVLRRAFKGNKIELMQELAKDPIDEEKINTLLENSLINQTALERRLGIRLLELRKTMTAEEALEFFGKRAEGFDRKRPDRFQPGSTENKRRMK